MAVNIEIRILLQHWWKKSYSAAAPTRESCEVKCESFVSERTAQNCSNSSKRAVEMFETNGDVRDRKSLMKRRW